MAVCQEEPIFPDSCERQLIQRGVFAPETPTPPGLTIACTEEMRILIKGSCSVIGPTISAILGIALMRLGGWTDWRACGLMIGLFVIPVWLWVLLPLYVLLPASSGLWRPLTCTSLGAISGAILVTIYCALSRDTSFELVVLYLPFAAIVGSVSCFVGALAARFFHGKKGPDTAYNPADKK